MTTETNAKSIILQHFFKYIFTILILSLTFFSFTGCKLGNAEIEIATRDATINDLTIDNSNDFALSMNYSMIPKVDINNLELTFKYKDGNGKTLTTKTKHLGNVTKGIQYKIEISLTEFGFFDLFKISYANISVSKGTVSLI